MTSINKVMNGHLKACKRLAWEKGYRVLQNTFPEALITCFQFINRWKQVDRFPDLHNKLLSLLLIETFVTSKTRCSNCIALQRTPFLQNIDSAKQKSIKIQQSKSDFSKIKPIKSKASFRITTTVQAYTQKVTKKEKKYKFK